jgi:hypothetical protein
MADLDKIAKALRFFNEKANKLERLSFLAKLEHPDSGVSISFDRVEEGKFQVQQERRGPDEEATDAFVLTFGSLCRTTNSLRFIAWKSII